MFEWREEVWVFTCAILLFRSPYGFVWHFTRLSNQSNIASTLEIGRQVHVVIELSWGAKLRWSATGPAL